MDFIALPCVYGLALEIWLCPFAALVCPMFVDYDPIQLYLGNFFPMKILAGITYCVMFSYGVTFILSYTINAAAYLELQILYSKKLIHGGSKFASSFSATSVKSSQFYNDYKRFQVMHLLFISGNEMSRLIFTTFIFVGVMIVTCTAYGTLRMYNQLPLMTYNCMPFATLVGFGIAIIFTIMASIPAENVTGFKEFWRQRVTQKRMRLLLAAVPKVGYDLGPYGVVTQEMGLTICDDFVQNTVDLMLLSPI